MLAALYGIIPVLVADTWPAPLAENECVSLQQMLDEMEADLVGGHVQHLPSPTPSPPQPPPLDPARAALNAALFAA